jgi:hypothetical protein
MILSAEPSPLHRYVDAFNRRDFVGMQQVFDVNLHTIHPGEPEVDVITAEPFLARMQALWPRGIHYRLLRTIVAGDFAVRGEVWGELVALDAQDKPLASELVVYKVEGGLVCEICVYKQMHPTHPAYQS